jgi:hypothetical protein
VATELRWTTSVSEVSCSMEGVEGGLRLKEIRRIVAGGWTSLKRGLGCGSDSDFQRRGGAPAIGWDKRSPEWCGGALGHFRVEETRGESSIHGVEKIELSGADNFCRKKIELSYST